MATPQRAVVRLVEDPDFVALSERDRVLCFAPLSFDASIFEVWGPLARGALACVYPDKPLDLADLTVFLRDFKVSVAFLTSGLFNSIVDQGLAELSAMRRLLTGGETLSAPHAAKFRQALPDCDLINVYGPTENTTFTTSHHILQTDQTGHSVIGRSIDHTSVHVVDHRLEPVPVGVIGELVIGGAGLARGYVGRPALTAERFPPDPFSISAGGRLYRSGDLASINPAGELVFRGRRDGQVKIRGFRIEIGEIENTLAKHPSIKKVAVLARDDGPSGKALVAYLETSEALDAEDPRRHVMSHLPAYMTPALFIRLDRLPLNLNGKIDRKALARRPRETRPIASTPPRTPLERELAEIWRDVLGLESVGVHDRFFEIGGHSLLATRS